VKLEAKALRSPRSLRSLAWPLRHDQPGRGFCRLIWGYLGSQKFIEEIACEIKIYKYDSFSMFISFW
jgi:hypothetical protein